MEPAVLPVLPAVGARFVASTHAHTAHIVTCSHRLITADIPRAPHTGRGVHICAGRLPQNLDHWRPGAVCASGRPAHCGRCVLMGGIMRAC